MALFWCVRQYVLALYKERYGRLDTDQFRTDGPFIKDIPGTLQDEEEDEEEEPTDTKDNAENATDVEPLM